MHLNEDRVQNALLPLLNKLGYHLVDVRDRKRGAVDIKAKNAKYGRYFEIEVKGEPGPTVKSPGSGRETRFILGLGQIVTRIHPKRRYYYGVAMPATYKPLVLRRVAPSLMKLLNLSFFFVTPRGTVEHFTWRDMDQS